MGNETEGRDEQGNWRRLVGIAVLMIVIIVGLALLDIVVAFITGLGR